MKKFFVFLIVALGISIFYQCEKDTVANKGNNEESLAVRSVTTSSVDDVSSDDVYSQGTLGYSCVDFSLCVDKGWKQYNDLHMPGTCTNFWAAAEVFDCNGEIVITDFNFLPCSSYNEYLLTLSDVYKAIALDSFRDAASKIFEYRYFEENGDLALCGTGSATVSSYVESVCYQWCLEIIGGPGEPVLESIGKVICGDKCCKKSSKVCKDTNGDLQFSNITYTSIGDSCDGVLRSSCSGRNKRLIGPCEHNCGN